jgi:hypothetical protein
MIRNNDHEIMEHFMHIFFQRFTRGHNIRLRVERNIAENIISIQRREEFWMCEKDEGI